MNKTQLDSRWWLIPVSAFLVAVFGLGALLISYPTPSHDVYWHMAMGREILDNHVFPVVDQFSFSFHGRELKHFPYVFQTIIYGLSKYLGFDVGAAVYLGFCYFGVLLLSLYYLYLLKANHIVVCMATAGVGLFLNMRLNVRPELLSYVFIVLAFIFYHRAYKAFGWRTMVPVYFLIVLWANYHSVIFGYIIFLGLFVDVAWNLFREKSPFPEWRRWFISGAGLLVVGFINPFLEHGFLQALQLDNAWGRYIYEYENIFFILKGYRGAYPITIFTLVTIGMAVWAKRYGFVVILLVFLSGAIQYSRLAVPCGIVITLVAGTLLANMGVHAGAGKGTRAFSGTFSTIYLIAFSLLFFAWYFAYKPKEKYWPSDLVAYFVSKSYSGNILNEYGVGGYLIYNLFPQARVFIDGRTDILYDVPFYEQYLRVRVFPAEMRDQAERGSVGYVVYPNTAEYNNVIYKTGIFTLDYRDDGYSLYKRGDTAFPMSGLLISQPNCWQESLLPALKDEIMKAKRISGLDPEFQSFLARLVEYSEANDQRNYLLSTSQSQDLGELEKRFMAYQAIAFDMPGISYNFLKGMSFGQPKDYLLMAYHLKTKGEFGEAAKWLMAVYNSDNMFFSDQDYFHFYNIANAINAGLSKAYIPKQILDGVYSLLSRSDIFGASHSGSALKFSCESLK